MPVNMIAIAALNPDGKQFAKSYSERVKTILPDFGGRPAARYELAESLVGKKSANVVLVVEFNDEESIRSFLNSEAYQALLSERDKGFKSMNIFLSH